MLLLLTNTLVSLWPRYAPVKKKGGKTKQTWYGCNHITCDARLATAGHSPEKPWAMTAERELFEIGEDELVSLYLDDLLLSHCVPSLRAMNWRDTVTRHCCRSILHASPAHAQIHEKTLYHYSSQNWRWGCTDAGSLRLNAPEAEKLLES